MYNEIKYFFKDISYNNNDNEISNNPSTSKIELNWVSSNPGRQDWDDYSPALLKTTLSKHLVTSPSDSVQVIKKLLLYMKRYPKSVQAQLPTKNDVILQTKKMKIACLNKTKIELEIS